MQRSKADTVENIAKVKEIVAGTIASSDEAPTPLHQLCQPSVFGLLDAKSVQWRSMEQLHRPQAR